MSCGLCFMLCGLCFACVVICGVCHITECRDLCCGV